VRAELRRDLTAALKARRPETVGASQGAGSAEAPRRALDRDELDAILRTDMSL
jgi:hypothetical protein